jgi:hypothetical protein
MLKKIFENKNYPSVMYLSMTIISLLLFFSLISILEEAGNNSTTGLAVNLPSQLSISHAYVVYYLILVILILLIIIITIIFSLEKMDAE